MDKRIQSALMRMGTQLIGIVPDPHDALYLAQQLVSYNPYAVKKVEPIWMNVQQYDWIGLPLGATPQVIDKRAVEFSPDEQTLLAMQRFQNLKRFEFLVKVAQGEGATDGELQKMSIATIDPHLYPDEKLLSEARARLARRDGLPVAVLLQGIRERQRTDGFTQPMKQAPQLGTMEMKLLDTHDVPSTIPVTANPASPILSSADKIETGGADDEEGLWQ